MELQDIGQSPVDGRAQGGLDKGTAGIQFLRVDTQLFYVCAVEFGSIRTQRRIAFAAHPLYDARHLAAYFPVVVSLALGENIELGAVGIFHAPHTPLLVGHLLDGCHQDTLCTQGFQLLQNIPEAFFMHHRLHGAPLLIE